MITLSKIDHLIYTGGLVESDPLDGLFIMAGLLNIDYWSVSRSRPEVDKVTDYEPIVRGCLYSSSLLQTDRRSS